MDILKLWNKVLALLILVSFIYSADGYSLEAQSGNALRVPMQSGSMGEAEKRLLTVLNQGGYSFTLDGVKIKSLGKKLAEALYKLGWLDIEVTKVEEKSVELTIDKDKIHMVIYSGNKLNKFIEEETKAIEGNLKNGNKVIIIASNTDHENILKRKGYIKRLMEEYRGGIFIMLAKSNSNSYRQSLLLTQNGGSYDFSDKDLADVLVKNRELIIAIERSI